MGLGAIDYALHCDRRPSLLVVTDIDDERLARAESISVSYTHLTRRWIYRPI